MIMEISIRLESDIPPDNRNVNSQAVVHTNTYSQPNVHSVTHKHTSLTMARILIAETRTLTCPLQSLITLYSTVCNNRVTNKHQLLTLKHTNRSFVRWGDSSKSNTLYISVMFQLPTSRVQRPLVGWCLGSKGENEVLLYTDVFT